MNKTAEIKTSYWSEKRDKFAAALAAAPGFVYEGGNPDEATRLMDALDDQGLLILPRSLDAGRWRVLADGKPVPHVGSRTGQPAGPMDAEEAAEAFLIAADKNVNVTVRPATDDEMVISAVLGDPVVVPEPAKVAVHGFFIDADTTLGALSLRVWDGNGQTVFLPMDDSTRMDIAEALGEALGD